MNELKNNPSKDAPEYLSIKGTFNKVVAPLALVSGITSIAHEWPRLEGFFGIVGRWISDLFSSPAHAANASVNSMSATHLSLSPYLPAICILGVFLVLLGSFGFALFSGRPEKETAKAWDLIKLICGFFIGTLTT